MRLPAAPQLPGQGLTDSVPVRWDEDCLTLNVWTPDPRGARPVLVWIPGGEFLLGRDDGPEVAEVIAFIRRSMQGRMGRSLETHR